MNNQLIDTKTLQAWTGYESLNDLEKFLKRNNIHYDKTNDGHIVTTMAAVDACFLQLKAEQNDEVIKMPEVERMTGLSRMTIHRKEKDRSFPLRIKLGTRSVGWYRSEIVAWLERQR